MLTPSIPLTSCLAKYHLSGHVKFLNIICGDCQLVLLLMGVSWWHVKAWDWFSAHCSCVAMASLSLNGHQHLHTISAALSCKAYMYLATVRLPMLFFWATTAVILRLCTTMHCVANSWTAAPNSTKSLHVVAYSRVYGLPCLLLMGPVVCLLLTGQSQQLGLMSAAASECAYIYLLCFRSIMSRSHFGPKSKGIVHSFAQSHSCNITARFVGTQHHKALRETTHPV